MEPAIRPKNKAVFVLLHGVVLGGVSAFFFVLLDNYISHRVATVWQVVATFVIFMAGGVPQGLWLWRRANAPPKKVSRKFEIARQLLFWGLMIGLACVLWVMARR